MRSSNFTTAMFLTMICKSLFRSWITLPILIISASAYSTPLENHIDIHTGQRIGILLAKQDPTLLPTLNSYREAMSPIQLKHGVEQFSLDIEAVIKGDLNLDVVDIYLSWAPEKMKNIGAEARSLPVVVEYGKIARASTSSPEALLLNMISSQHYQLNFPKNMINTITYIWLKPEEKEDYARYEAGMRDIADRLGVINQGRFETKNSDFSTTFGDSITAPDYVIFNQWPSSESIKNYFNSKEYKQFGPYLESGTKDFTILQFNNDSFFSSTEVGFRIAPETL